MGAASDSLSLRHHCHNGHECMQQVGIDASLKFMCPLTFGYGPVTEGECDGKQFPVKMEIPDDIDVTLLAKVLTVGMSFYSEKSATDGKLAWPWTPKPKKGPCEQAVYD